jgi:colanic acid biosynthesis glycosyl transferase WcaI
VRILLLNQSFPPDSTATAQHLADLARRLRDLGHQIHVIADRCDYEQRSKIYRSHEQWEGIDVRRVRSTAFGKRSFAGRLCDGISFLAFATWELLRMPKPNLVISFTSPPLIGLLGVFYAQFVGAGSVHWLMDLNIDAAIATGRLKERSPLGRLLLGLFRLSLAKSQHVIVEDRYTAQRAIERGARPETVTIIPPWPANVPLPAESTGAAAFRVEQGIDSQFVVMFSGNHASVHPLDTLLEAARQLDGQGFLFLFIGGGDRVRDVTEAIQRHHLRDVRQLPLQPRERLADTLAAADLHIVVMGDAMNGLGHPSKMYGVLAAGTPYVFIGPKKSFAGDILAECPFGFLVEHGDTARLITALHRARALTPDERATYRQANRAYLAQRFGFDRSMAIFDAAVLGLQPSAS